MMQPSHEAHAGETEAPRFVQYVFLKVDSAWRRLSESERTQGKREFLAALDAGASQGIKTFSYSTIGLKVGADLMLWRIADSIDSLQRGLSQLLQTGLGRYMDVSYLLWGMTRPSQYTKRRTTQEQAVDEQDRLPYLTVYPFSKTAEWYLMSREARQGMMNEHMRVGHEYAQVRQVLLYTTGLDDQEFVVAYETDDLFAYQSLLIALRSTEARRYTSKDQPIFTCIHHSHADAVGLI
jgi:chlorite dismutase